MTQARHPTIRTRLHEIDNDYRALERRYAGHTGEPLTGDPFVAEPGPRPTPPSVTLVIPAFNAADTIDLCLRSIGESTFSERFSHLLQIVVVDDGSVDATSRVVADRLSSANGRVVRQPHGGRASAMNAGLAAAEGDVVISCDADMLLTRHTIEALARRHQLLDGVLLIGFRSDLRPDSTARNPTPGRLRDLLAGPALVDDNRLSFDWPGWPENMIQTGDKLRSLGCGRSLWMPSGEAWPLPRMVFGCLFSIRRADLEALGGYNARFKGWGWEDTELAARALAAGHYIIPVYSASGYHLPHAARSPFQWREGDRNRRLYQELLDQTAPHSSRSNSFAADGLTTIHTDPSHTEAEVVSPVRHLRSEGESIRTARTLAAVGRFDEALRVLDLVGRHSAEGLLNAGKIRLAVGQADRALESLRQAVSLGGPCQVEARTQLGLAEAAAGRFAVARQVLTEALEIDPRDRLLRYVLKCPAHRHRRRGHRYADHGYHLIAVRDFEAALVQVPGDTDAFAARQVSLDEMAAA